MLRIHLTREDLVRTRLVATHGPASEAIFAAAWSSRHRSHPVLDHWRATLRSRPGRWTSTMRALVHAGRLGHPPVDLFTLMGASTDLDHAVDELAGRNADAVRFELADAVAVWRKEGLPAPARLTDLAKAAYDNRRPGESFGPVIRRTFDEFLGPVWPRTQAYLAEQHLRRSLTLSQHGIDRLLNELHPGTRWESPTLMIPSFSPHNPEMHLAGRGLLLAPSLFLTPNPFVYIPAHDATAPLIVFFPATPDVEDAARIWADPTVGAGARLGTLLGRTRAAALDALQREASTTELAQRIYVSPATASEHASVLRAAGLVRTRRDGGSVVHSVTELGRSLLNGS